MSPRDEVPSLQEAINGYHLFKELSEGSAQRVMNKTARNARPAVKKTPPEVFLAQDAEIQQLMARFSAQAPDGVLVQQMERLVRVAVFQSANELVGFLLQEAADRINADYQPKPGQHYKGRVRLEAQGMFGRFVLWRAYYYDPVQKRGISPTPAWDWNWVTPRPWPA